MSIYYQNSGLSWNQYLQANSFVQDVTGAIRKSGKESRYAISDQSRQFVASNDALSRTFQNGFDQLNGTLADGFGMIGQGLDAVSQGIERLGAAFEWGMSLLAEQLEAQTKLLTGILQRLDAIHATLQTPALTQAREFYMIGRDRLSKGLLDKALEAFHKAEEKNDTDFLIQYALGHLYLYGVNEDCNVIDLSKAEKHFRAAARYAKPEIPKLIEAKKYCGEAYFHASVACYAQASEQQRAGNHTGVQRFLGGAVNLARQATEIYPEFPEAFYQFAKTSALAGDTQEAVQSLALAVKADRNYCLKADVDRDFDGIRPNIVKLFETLCQQAQEHARKALDDLRSLIDDNVYLTDAAKRTKLRLDSILEQAERYYQRGTYFDCLDAIEHLGQARDMFHESMHPYALLGTFQGHKKDVVSVAFSPDGRYVASGSWDKTVRLWEVPTGKVVATLDGDKGGVFSVAFSPDGQYLASAGGDKTVRLWEVSMGRVAILLEGSTQWNSSVVFSPNGRYVASGSADNAVRLWEVPTGKVAATLEGHTHAVYCVAFSPDGQYLTSGSLDKTARLWEVSIRKVAAILEGNTEQVHCVAFSPDGRYVASGGLDNVDNAVRLWEVPTGKVVAILKGATARVSSVAFSPDGRYLASGGWGARLWEVSTGKLVAILEGGTKQEVCSVAFSPDGRYVVSGGADTTVRLWEQQFISKCEYEARRQREERSRKEQEQIRDRRAQGLCESCGTALGLLDKMTGQSKCKKCRAK